MNSRLATYFGPDGATCVPGIRYFLVSGVLLLTISFLRKAMAAEDTEASLKGLPNAKTTRYIEMGKSEMEVSIKFEKRWHQNHS